MKPLGKSTSAADLGELRRMLRAGQSVLRSLVDLLPRELDPRTGDEDVCVVFADIAGYSDFVARAGDDAAIAVLLALDEVVEAEISKVRGARVVKRLGDGQMLVVRQPEDAVRLAVGLASGFREMAASQQWPLQLRAGVHRGVCRRRGEDYFGYHVNVAARVAEAAIPGEAFASMEVLEGVDPEELGLYAANVGALRAKGVIDRVDLVALSDEPIAGRGVWSALRGLLHPDG